MRLDIEGNCKGAKYGTKIVGEGKERALGWSSGAREESWKRLQFLC
jgi:hypothetical protein